MKIKMRTLAAGPKGIHHPDSIRDVSPEEAAALIEGGFADRVDGDGVRQATISPPARAVDPKPTNPVAPPAKPVAPPAKK